MNKNQWLKFVNPVLFFVFVVQAVTGLVIFSQWNIPPLGVIFEIHKYNGLMMIVLAMIHLTLNWNWVKANFFNKP